MFTEQAVASITYCRILYFVYHLCFYCHCTALIV